ncbi:MAG: hypothetical protein IKD93_08540 [Firmicutes bacterium]|nr:hypothetical protein [Bacillota bacterium]
MSSDPRWRFRARELLFNYTTFRELLRRGEQAVIDGQGAPRDGRYRRGGVRNPTQAKALLLDSAARRRMEAQVRAAERLIVALRADGRRHRLKALRLLELVYIRHSHSLFYASLELEISERTAKRMNSELLSFVAREMGWLDPQEAEERYHAPRRPALSPALPGTKRETAPAAPESPPPRPGNQPEQRSCQ